MEEIKKFNKEQEGNEILSYFNKKRLETRDAMKNLSDLDTLRSILICRKHILKCSTVHQKMNSFWKMRKNKAVINICDRKIKNSYKHFLLKKEKYFNCKYHHSLRHFMCRYEKDNFRLDFCPLLTKLSYIKRRNLWLRRIKKHCRSLCTINSLLKKRITKKDDWKWYHWVNYRKGKRTKRNHNCLSDLVKGRKEIINLYYKIKKLIILNKKRWKFITVVNYLLFLKNLINVYLVTYVYVLRKLTTETDLIFKKELFEVKKRKESMQLNSMSTFSFTNKNRYEAKSQSSKNKNTDNFLFVYLMTVLCITYFSLATKTLQVYEKNSHKIYVILQIIFSNEYYALYVTRKNSVLKNRGYILSKRKELSHKLSFYKSNLFFLFSKIVKYINTIFLSFERYDFVKEERNVKLVLLLFMSILLKHMSLSHFETSIFNNNICQVKNFKIVGETANYKLRIKNLFLLIEHHFINMFFKKRFFSFFEFSFILYSKWKNDKRDVTFDMLIYIVLQLMRSRWKSQMLYFYYKIYARFLNVLAVQNFVKRKQKYRYCSFPKKGFNRAILPEKEYIKRQNLSLNKFLIHITNKYFLLFLISCYSDQNKCLLRFSNIFLKILISISLLKNRVVESHFYEIQVLNFFLHHLDVISKRKKNCKSVLCCVSVKSENTTPHKSTSSQPSFIYNKVLIPRLQLKNASSLSEFFEPSRIKEKRLESHSMCAEEYTNNFLLNKKEKKKTSQYKKCTKKEVQSFLKKLEKASKWSLTENNTFLMYGKKMYEHIFIKDKSSTWELILVLVYSLLLSHDKRKLSHLYFNENYYSREAESIVGRGNKEKVNDSNEVATKIGKNMTLKTAFQTRKENRRYKVNNIKPILKEIFFFHTLIKEDFCIMKILQVYINKEKNKKDLVNTEKLKKRIIKETTPSCYLNFVILMNLSIWNRKNVKKFQNWKKISTGMYGIVYECNYSLFKEHPLVMKVINVKKEATENYSFLHIFNEISCLLKFQCTGINVCQLYSYGIMKNGKSFSYFLLLKFYQMNLNRFLSILHNQYIEGLNNCRKKKMTKKKRQNEKEHVSVRHLEKRRIWNRIFKKKYYFKRNIFNRKARNRYTVILIKISTIYLFHFQFLSFVLSIFIKVVKLIKVLHKKNIIHFDISTDNILVDLRGWDFMTVNNLIKDKKHILLLCFYKNRFWLNTVRKIFLKLPEKYYYKYANAVYLPNFIITDFGESKTFHTYEDFLYFRKNRGNEISAAPELFHHSKQTKRTSLRRHQSLKKWQRFQSPTDEQVQLEMEKTSGIASQQVYCRNNVTRKKVAHSKNNLKKQKYEKNKYCKSDVWSLGCLLREMLTNKCIKEDNTLLFLKINGKQKVLDTYTTIKKNTFYKEINELLHFFFQLDLKKRKSLQSIYKESLKLLNLYVKKIIEESEMLKQLKTSSYNYFNKKNKKKNKTETSFFEKINALLFLERKKALASDLDKLWKTFSLFLWQRIGIHNENNFSNNYEIEKNYYFFPLAHFKTENVIALLNDLIKCNICVIGNFYFIYKLNKESTKFVFSENIPNATTVYSFAPFCEYFHISSNINFVDVQILYSKKKKFYKKNKNTRKYFVKWLHSIKQKSGNNYNKLSTMTKVKSFGNNLKNEAYFFLIFFINLMLKFKKNCKMKNSVFILNNICCASTFNFLRKSFFCKNLGTLFLFLFLSVTFQIPITHFFFFFESNSSFFFSDEELSLLKQIIYSFF